MKRSLSIFFLLVLVGSAAADDEMRYSVPIGDSPSLGPANAPVTIIEFLDFQ